MQVVIKVSALRKSERHKQYEILRFDDYYAIYSMKNDEIIFNELYREINRKNYKQSNGNLISSSYIQKTLKFGDFIIYKTVP